MLVLNSVNFVVELGILDLEVCLLYEVRDFLELVECVVGVVEHDPVEYLGEVGIQVKLDCAALVAGLLQLRLDAL